MSPKSTEQELHICGQFGVDLKEYLDMKRIEIDSDANRELSDSETSEIKTKVMAMMGISPEEARKREADAQKKSAAAAPLSPEEVEVCRLMGVEPLEYWAENMKASGQKLVV